MGLIDSTGAWLLGGAGAILVVASIITWLLGRALNPEKHGDLLSNLRARVGAWWVMVAALTLVFLGGETLAVLLFAFLSFLGLREFITISRTTQRDYPALALMFFVVLPLHYIAVWQHWYGFFAVFIPVYAFLFLPARGAMAGETKSFLRRTAVIQWALMVCVYAVSHTVAIMQLPLAMEIGRSAAEESGPGTVGAAGANLLMFFLIVVQGSDVLQYVWGKTLGKHPIAPTVSPNKTWEGFIGGVLTATALGAALWWATPFNPWQAAALAFVSCVMGFLGGLVMSAIKRDRGIKDFGALIPGHGGIMDRIDSLCFAAPVFFHLVRFFFT